MSYHRHLRGFVTSVVMLDRMSLKNFIIRWTFMKASYFVNVSNEIT